MSSVECSVADCHFLGTRRGMCHLHYRRFMKHGADGLNDSRLLHGYTGTKVHNAWNAMFSRCLNSNCKSYPRYGGRGITICPRWSHFLNFLADMGEPPAGLSLDRINNDGNYEPSNCRWATAVEQNRNNSMARPITFNGETLCTGEWEQRLGLSQGALSLRLKKGWPLGRALTTMKVVRAKTHHALRETS